VNSAPGPKTHPGIAPRSSWTERARKQACRWVGRDGHSVAAVARDLGLGWATVMAAVIDHGSELIEREDRIGEVCAVGVDETAFLRANHVRSTIWLFANESALVAGGYPRPGVVSLN
jgi:transposase